MTIQDTTGKHKKQGHSGMKTHKCKICYKTFSQGSNLKTHVKTHNGEKDYKCKVCAKIFCWADH